MMVNMSLLYICGINLHFIQENNCTHLHLLSTGIIIHVGIHERYFCSCASLLNTEHLCWTQNTWPVSCGLMIMTHKLDHGSEAFTRCHRLLSLINQTMWLHIGSGFGNLTLFIFLGGNWRHDKTQFDAQMFCFLSS
jgi:hypothetical protein